jgi:hypothetical protein
MGIRQRNLSLALAGLWLLLVACGGEGDPAEPTIGVVSEDPVATSVQQTVVAISVAQTVAALTSPPSGETAPPTPTLAPTATGAPTASEPTPAPESLPSPTTAVPPTSQASVCIVINGVYLRSGPGTIYDPPVGLAGVDAQLIPLALSPIGYPLGQWVLVQVAGTDQVAWVSAGPQWIECNIDLASLPPAESIPPTPVPLASPTATATTFIARPNIDNDAPGGSFPTGHVLGEVIVDPTFLFRMDVRDLNVGNFEGAGVESVEFSVTGNGVDYFRRESTAGFCVFGGGEPTCNPWPVNSQGQFIWGEGGPVVQSGDYFASITVTSEEPDPDFGNVWNWNFDFRVTVP